MKTITTDDDHLLPSEVELPRETARQRFTANEAALRAMRFLRPPLKIEPEPRVEDVSLPRIK